jgi:NAD(P)-dependent dehydrogenase (short-subunit alcohol dehydrogenase family)
MSGVLNGLFMASGVVITGVVGLVLYLFATMPSVTYPKDHIEQLFRDSPIRKTLEKEGKKPIVIVTGSTGGIGEGTAKELYRLGFHVILASRSESKLKTVAADLQKQVPNAKGVIDYHQLDVGDLDSVKAFVDWYKSKYDYVNYIVNNAGTHYFENGKLMDPKANTLSKQGYDEVFSTNYMGHFLLTHLLLPLMKEGRVVNAASSYHLQTDSSIISIKDESGPKAANGHNATVKHKRLAYGVSKLTNVLHAKQLHRVLCTEGKQNKIQAISFCPGWVITNMVPSGVIRKVIYSFAFPVDTGILAPISDILEPSLKGGEFTCNIDPPVIPSWLFPVLTATGLRYIFFELFLLSVAFIEARLYGFSIARCSPEASDEKLAKDLYDWTIKELKKKSYIQ